MLNFVACFMFFIFGQENNEGENDGIPPVASMLVLRAFIGNSLSEKHIERNNPKGVEDSAWISYIWMMLSNLIHTVGILVQRSLNSF